MRTSVLWAAAPLLLLACKDPGVTPDPSSTQPATTAASKPAPAAMARPAGNLDPSPTREKAPEVFRAQFTTSKGKFTIEVHREWSPNGADRFHELISKGFYNDTRFFRAVEGFMVQFGLHGSPDVNRKWRAANIPDDPVKQSNKRGFVSFAMAGPGSRTSQIFVNYNDSNARLDAMGFSPFGQVVEGMDVVDNLYKGYGEGAPRGKGPDQGRIQAEGNAYLDKDFPQLDRVLSASLLR